VSESNQLEPMSENDPAGQGLECDFCQSTASSVRRVALDGDYERLITPHAVQYACPDCFERKDRARLGVAAAG
jgi:hypothetical protein